MQLSNPSEWYTFLFYDQKRDILGIVLQIYFLDYIKFDLGHKKKI